jgi:hypothetical protein
MPIIMSTLMLNLTAPNCRQLNEAREALAKQNL